MPFDAYKKLLRGIEKWMERPDLVGDIPDFVRLTEVKLARALKWRFTNVATDGSDTLTADQDYITLPTGCLEVESFQLDSSEGPFPVDIVGPAEFIEKKRGLEGFRPAVARHVGLTLKLAPTPTVEDNYTLWYQSVITGLDEDNATNWLLANAFDILLYGSLKEGWDFVGDYGAGQKWGADYKSALPELRRLEWRARAGGGPLRTHHDIDPGGLPDRLR